MAQSQTTNPILKDNATTEAKLTLHKLTLLGTFGAMKNRGALVRLPDGAVEKVATGDTVTGLRVVAIADSHILLVAGPTEHRLSIPGN